MNGAIDIGLYIVYFLLIIAVLGVIVFPTLQIASDLKSAKGTVFGIGILLVVFLVSYALSTPDTGAFYDKMNVSPSLSKFIGAGLIATYITFAGVVIGIVYAQVSQWLR